MKKYILIAMLTCIMGAGYTQNTIPNNAAVAIKYYGAHLSNSMPVQKLESYAFIKNNLLKHFKIDSLGSLEKTGIDFEKDISQYLLMGDSSMTFVTAFTIKDTKQLLQLVKLNYEGELLTQKKNGIELLALDNDKYLGLNDKQGILIYTHYTRSSYNYYDTTAIVAPAVDSAMTPATVEVDSVIVTAPEEPLEMKEPVKKSKTTKNKATNKGKSKAKNSKTKKKTAPKKVIVEEEAWDTTDQEVMQDSTYTQPLHDAEINYALADSIAEAKRIAWSAAQDEYIKNKQYNIADSIFQLSFSGKVVALENEISYKKVIDPSAHVTIWLNYDNIINQIGSYFSGGLYNRSYYSAFAGAAAAKDNSNFKTGVNVYFDKDKVRVEQKAYSPNGEMANLGKEIYHSKFNKQLAGYVNPDHIAYFSASVNTEALTNYYYKLIRQYLSNTPYVKEYSDVVDAYMDFMEIIIDEKGIADLLPGNMVFVLHDLKTKTVTYKDYTYDQDFKQTEVEKTKQELSPNFTFAIETKKPAFMEKLVRLPLKYAEKEHYNYKDKGGYYEFDFDSSKYPISNLFFIVKDNKLVITTSKEIVDLTLGNSGYPLNAMLKKSMLKNNYSFRLDTKKMLQQISPELSTELNRKIRKYLEDNLSEVTMESRIKDDMIQTSAIMNVTGQHTNSLECLFNIIDSINNIMESDKKEKDEKVY